MIYILIIFIIICKLIIGAKFQEIVELKGYEDNYFWYCFFFGIIGALMVIALPDKSVHEDSNQNAPEIKSNKNTEMTNLNPYIPSQEKLTNISQTNVKNEAQLSNSRTPKSDGNVTMYIDETICVGCGKCTRVCPNEAIDGNMKEVHHINGNCLECGLCIEACSLGAIKS